MPFRRIIALPLAALVSFSLIGCTSPTSGASVGAAHGCEEIRATLTEFFENLERAGLATSIGVTPEDLKAGAPLIDATADKLDALDLPGTLSESATYMSGILRDMSAAAARGDEKTLEVLSENIDDAQAKPVADCMAD